MINPFSNNVITLQTTIKVDRERKKEALQNKMAYGTIEDLKQPKPGRQLRLQAVPPQPTKSERIRELTEEIQDRVSFLDDMRSLGQENRYSTVTTKRKKN